MRKENVVITGVTGFAGAYHLKEALTHGKKVIGVGRNENRLAELKRTHNHHFSPVKMDLTIQSGELQELLTQSKPEFIIHLAALSDPVQARLKPDATLSNNFLSTLNVMEAVRRSSPETIIVISTSSYLYGDKAAGELKEDMPVNPQEPYGDSKLNDRLLMKRYHDMYGLNIVEARIFNHLGPGRRAGLQSTIIKKAVEAHISNKPAQIEVPSLKYTRDIQHPQNWADASLILASCNKPSEAFNVCSGEYHSLSDFIDAVSQEVGAKIEVIENTKLLAKGSPLVSWGNNSKLRNINWSPRVTFPEMIHDTAKFWSEELRHV